MGQCRVEKLGRQASPAGFRRFALAAVLAAFGALLWSAPPASAAPVVDLTLVKTIATSGFTPSSPDPSGIVYRPGRDRLLIADSEVDEMPLYQGFNLFTATRAGSGVGSGTTLPASREPTDLGFNPSAGGGTLFISDDDRERVWVVRPGADGRHGTGDDIVSSFSTSVFGSTDAEGVVYDPATGHVFIGDGLGLEIYRVNPVNGVFGDGNDVVTHFDLARYGLGDCEGLGIDTGRNRLLAVDQTTDAIYELGKGGGTLFRILDLSAIPTARSLVADVTLAPTSNPNDSASAQDYWIVDRHVDNKADPNENDGLLYEMR